MRRLLPWGIALFSSVGATHAQSVASDEEAARSWFQASWDRAQRFPNFIENRDLTWRVELHLAPSRAELDRLRDEVARTAEHPESEMIEAYERRVRGQPDIIRRRFIAGAPGSWRLNEGEQAFFHDVVRTPRSAWDLTASSLDLYSPRDLPPGRRTSDVNANLATHLGLLLTGGFTKGLVSDLEPRFISFHDGTWTAEGHRRSAATGSQEFAVRFVGRFDPQTERGWVEEVTTIKNGYAKQSVGERVEIEGWHTPLHATWPVAREARRYTADGRLHYVVVLERDAVPERGLLDAAFVPPTTATHVDPLRGTVRPSEVADLRGGYEIRQEGAILHVTPRSGSLPRNLAYRVIGWVLAGAIVGMVAVLWYRRSLARAAARHT